MIDARVVLRESDQVYLHEDGRQFASVSKLRKMVEEPFDAEMVSMRMAKGDMEKQEAILAEWKAKGDHAMSEGTLCDKAIERYFATGKDEGSRYSQTAFSVFNLLQEYKKRYLKKVVWSEEHGVAGEVDILTMRTKTIGDYWDGKIKVYKGVQQVSKGNTFMREPLAHLENCTYNDYAMQLSIYGVLGELCYGIKPGKLTIIQYYYDRPGEYELIPVNYMKYEAYSLLEAWKKRSNEHF